MKTMFKNIENVKILDIAKGVSKQRSSVTNKKSHSFVLRTSGTMLYKFRNTSIEVHPGSIVFVPRGSDYEFATLSDEPCEYISLRFDADVTDAVPSVYPFDGFQDAEVFTNTLAELWRFGDRADHYKCYSVFYNLLVYIESLEKQAYMDKRKNSIILPGIEYLKEHIYDCDLKIETLHRICGISGTYFRQIFQANYMVSPQVYILGKRLSHARAIIDSGDFDSISEVAASVGYNDALYFSRAFRRKYGVSPSGYAKARTE